LTGERPDRPSLLWRATLASLARLPQGLLSRGAGWLADRKLPPPLRSAVLGGFAQAVGIDVSEAEHPIEAYPSLNHFFVRRLRPGVRSWPMDPAVAGSPVDGIAGRSGAIRDGELLQAKGRWYGAAEFLGSEEEAAPYLGGSFLTLYLSPRHYHRIHTPCQGRIVAARHIPGGLLPVNVPAVTHVPRLFARNERLVVHLEGPGGRVALVAVGATNVGAISTRFDPLWTAGGGAGAEGEGNGDVGGPGEGPRESSSRVPRTREEAEAAVLRVHPPRPITNQQERPPPVRSYRPGIQVQVGEEILAFHLGSTVILLSEPGGYVWESLPPGSDVVLGMPVGAAGAVRAGD
jgi:phosphatidylserine decarboxylase